MTGRGPDELVSLARAGDQLAWKQLYQRDAGRLVAWLRWLPRPDGAVADEDVAAQAWLTAATKIHEFRGSDDDFTGWLFGIARHHALNDYRRGVRRQTRPADVVRLETSSVEAERDLGLVEDHDATRRLLALLSPREAEVIACIDVAGLDVRATATALGMSASAVRVARHRGLARLRRLLEANDAPDAASVTPVEGSAG
ncbi:RNA polymerase sigma factor [Nocardioides halotolerans]|uniref:RNA polymerase sigma factor n=1 Tax=Nocardioides halotolerans TaxID=433660 RepID=UPI0004022A93|nr:sigma-70 family RNA polymerase sigma factor [Nocardioides halotolerans]